MKSHARAVTDKAVRYMTQLAKHWGHRLEVTLDERHARIVLPLGVCTMAASAEALDVTVEGADAGAIARLQEIVGSHLARFAFREGELSLGWTPAA